MKKMDEKIPMPPLPPKVELFMPLAFWSQILMTLDKKTQTISEIYGFGKVSLTLSIKNGGIAAVNFIDDIRIEGQILTDKAKHPKPDKT